MRLLQLVTGPGELLDLHPHVTVVHGLDAATRAQLITSVTDLARGRCAGEGLLEAHGVLFDLDPSLLALLDLPRDDIDPVVRAGDLPSQPLTVDEQELRAREQAFADLLTRIADQVERHAQVTAGLEAAAAALSRARVARAEAAEAIAARQAAAPPSDPLPPEPVDGALDDDGGRADEVERRLAVVEHVLATLSDHDPDAAEEVRRTLAALRGPADVDLVPSEEAAALADDLAAADRRLEADDGGAVDDLTAEETAAARSRLEAARATLAEAEGAARSVELDPTLTAELDANHEALLDAVDRTDGRFGAGRARVRVEELRAVEDELLERLGLISYAERLMGPTSNRRDPAREAALEAAQAELASAEEAWREVERRTEAALARAAHLDRRRQLRDQAAALLGDRWQGPERAEADLRALRVPRVGAEERMSALRSALDHVGVDVADEALEAEDLELVAAAWLAEADGVEDRASALRSEQATLRAEALELEGPGQPVDPGDPSSTEDPGPVPAEPELPGPDVDALDAAVEEAERRHAAALAEVERESGALAALDEEGQATAAEVERLQDIVAAQGDGTLTQASEIEWYLLARIASQRSVSVAGSLPLVLDDALRGLEPADVAHLLDRLERMSETVQVIVVSDDPATGAWAEAAGVARAALVAPGPI